MHSVCCEVANTTYFKLVQDMRYEARVRAIIKYHANRRKWVTKKEARNMRLTREQFLQK